VPGIKRYKIKYNLQKAVSIMDISKLGWLGFVGFLGVFSRAK